MRGKLVTVFGGTGFIGRHLVQRLAARGARVRVAVRNPRDAAILQPMGDVGQIAAMRATVTNAESVRAAVAGADAVVNLVGILYESGRMTFDAVHARGAENVARAARDAGVGAMVHMSALGADPNSHAKYATSKAAGEAAVRAAFPGAAIIRPSVVFGPEDGFYNLFAGIAQISPILPVFGRGDGVKFQPVYVGDVAGAMLRCLEDPSCAGRTYELGGPQAYGFRQVMQAICRETGRKRLFVPFPYILASLQAGILQLLPKPLLTTDQVELLKVDNVVSGKLPGLAELGIAPTAAESIIPTYLDRYRAGGRFTKPLKA